MIAYYVEKSNPFTDIVTSTWTIDGTIDDIYQLIFMDMTKYHSDNGARLEFLRWMRECFVTYSHSLELNPSEEFETPSLYSYKVSKFHILPGDEQYPSTPYVEEALQRLENSSSAETETDRIWEKNVFILSDLTVQGLRELLPEMKGSASKDSAQNIDASWNSRVHQYNKNLYEMEPWEHRALLLDFAECRKSWYRIGSNQEFSTRLQIAYPFLEEPMGAFEENRPERFTRRWLDNLTTKELWGIVHNIQLQYPVEIKEHPYLNDIFSTEDINYIQNGTPDGRIKTVLALSRFMHDHYLKRPTLKTAREWLEERVV